MPERLYRYIETAQADFDEKARSLKVAFASETPVIRIGTPRDKLVRNGEEFYEVLSHDPADVDLSDLNDAGPFLDEHDEKRQLGKVKSAKVDGDRIARAELVYDETTLANDRYGQMRSRTRPHISAGYRWKAIVGRDRAADGLPIYRFSWVADEISSVALPADRKVGVGRSAVDSNETVDVEQVAKNLTPEQRAQMKRSLLLLDPVPAAGGGGATVVDETKVREDERGKTRTTTLSDERKRTKEISTIADALVKDHGAKDGGKLGDKIRSMANEAIAKDETVGDFKMRCMEDVLKAKPAVPVLIEQCMDDPSQYSLLRGIQSCLRRRSNIPDGQEGEVHQEIMIRSKEFGGLGYEAEGFQVPANAPLRNGTLTRSERRRMTRDMQATVFNAGGAFVPTTLVVPIIEILRNMMVLDKAGITVMAGLQGNIVIPRQEAASTAYSVSEIGLLTDSQQVLGQIAMAPKRVGATQTYSKQFVMQSSPDAEAFMRDDLFKVIALRWDYLGLNGQGAADEPLGIMHTPGIGSIVFGATPTYIKIVAMETAIRAANVTDPLTYLSTSTVKGALKTVAEALTGATTIGGSQNALWKDRGVGSGEMNGHPAFDSQQVPNNQVVLGAFRHLIQALWGGLDVVVDQFTKAKNAETVIAINTWGDFALRHAQAFNVSADAGNQ